jgi:DNA-binding PadR family transcriptional regulator
MTEKYLSRPEEIVLMAVWKLTGEAYGVAIRRLVQEMSGKYWSIGAVYVPLERLEKKGLLASDYSDPSPERGGRRKRFFRITRAGRRELDALFHMNAEIWREYRELNPERGS